MSLESIDSVVDKVLSIARCSPEDRDWRSFYHGYSYGVNPSVYDKELEDIEHSSAIELLVDSIMEAIDTAKKHGAREAIATRGGLSIVLSEVIIANSYGDRVSSKFSKVMMYYDVKSIDSSGSESTYPAIYTSRRLDKEEVIEEAKRAGEYSTLFFKARTIESGVYQLLLTPRVTAAVIESSLAPAFSALNIQENRSPLKGRVGEEVLSRSITIIDDPSIDWLYGSTPFDDEGHATYRKAVVENGVFKQILYNHYTACRDGVESTGNGFRRSPSSSTYPGFTNLVLESRETSGFDELVASVKKGIVVYGVIGYWMSNPVNGGVQATITHGLYVENGGVKYPVKGVVMGGNIYEWLGGRLAGVSRERECIENMCVPGILVNEASIAGHGG